MKLIINSKDQIICQILITPLIDHPLKYLKSEPVYGRVPGILKNGFNH